MVALAAYVISRQRVRGPVELTLVLTGHKRIQELNRRFRGVDRTTDVISFKSALPPLPNPLPRRERGDTSPPPSRGRVAEGRERGFSGDLAINVQQAVLQAKEMDHPIRREIRLLFIHGILHLLGYTDYEPQPRRRMFKRQNALLRRWERVHP